MPRMIELVRARAVPAALMRSAASGALSLPACERIEILLHLADSGSDLSEEAKQSLAQLNREDAEAAITDPLAVKDVLQHLAGAGTLVAEALPLVLRNSQFRIQSLAWIAAAASRENIEILIASRRVCESLEILNALNTNPNLSPAQSEAVSTHIEELVTRSAPVAEMIRNAESALAIHEAAPALEVEPTRMSAPETAAEQEFPVVAPPAGLASDPEVAAFFQEHAEELATIEEKAFQPFGDAADLEEADAAEQTQEELATLAMAAAAATTSVTTSTAPVEATTPDEAADPDQAEDHPDRKPVARKAHLGGNEERGSALQKIAKLDVKGRIQLAMKGNKEERSILVRDGTKLVALAVLDSPKITDGEVEKFASQRNVQEAVLRGIPMKRRFMKNYIVVRNLVSNPRMPIDLALGLMKNLLVNDLKNLSGNKEVSETVRKLALKMYKQKTDTSKKHS